MAITTEAFDAATRRGKRLEAEYAAESAAYELASGMVKVNLRSRKTIRFHPEAIRGLEHARPDQLQNLELGPAGVSLYFPDVDVELSIPGLYHDADGRRIIVS